MNLKPYPKYKESGIPWIGEIPEGWEVGRLKYVCTNYAEYGLNIPSDNYQTGGIRFIRTTDIDDYGNLQNGGVYLNKSLCKGYTLNSGDLLISRSGTIGRTFLFNPEKNGEATYAGYLVRFSINKNKAIPKYVFYFTKTNSFYGWLEIQSIETTIENVNGQKYANLLLTIPSLPDQTSIANFLDKKTSKIDTLIDKDKKLIELLKEKRTALINHAVTKGLDPNVKLKDSGIEWIGEIPKGWEIRKFSHIADKIVVGFVGPIENYYTDEEEGVPLLKTGNVGYGKILVENLSYVTKKFHLKNRKSQLKPGDIVIARHGESGRSCVIPQSINEANCLNIVVLKPGKKMNGIYYSYVLNSYLFQEHLQAIQGGAVQGVINTEDISCLKIFHPSLSEQKRISQYLDKATSKIDKTIRKIEKKIELLEEYKKSLIHHVVTGKVDVRGVVT